MRSFALRNMAAHCALKNNGAGAGAGAVRQQQQSSAHFLTQQDYNSAGYGGEKGAAAGAGAAGAARLRSTSS